MRRDAVVAGLAVALAAAAACKNQPAPPPPPPPPPMAKPQAVTVTIRNHRPDPIWVSIPGPCSPLPAHLETKAGALVPLADPAASCDDAARGACPPPAVCPGPRALRIAGDGQVVVRWDGQVVRPRTLARTAGGCPAQCVDRGGPPPALYYLRGEAWSACSGDGCDCAEATPGAGCAKPAALTGPPDLKASVPLDVPGELGVTLMFE